MRDLAGQDFRTKTSASKLKVIFRLILILIVIVGIFAFVKAIFLSQKSVGGSSIVLQEAPRGLTPVSVGKVTSIVQGVDLTTQKAVLKDVKYGGEASGVATRSFGGGTYILSVEATLPDPKGNDYAVWIVGNGETVLIDYMRGLKNSWSLTLRDKDKYSKYDGIWVTLERTRDNKAEEHVLEGSF